SAPDPAAFAALGERVRAALSDRGFTSPTEPQRKAIGPIASGQHTLVVAPTGTGKTETAMLPVFDALAGTDRFGIGALYVTPLRALNRDMQERLEWWGDRLDLDIQVRHGDTSDYRRRQQAIDPPDVLVTTPESLQAMLTGERLREALADLSHVIVDEVHELAASKRGAQLAVGLERLREVSGPNQRIGLSATVGDPDAVAAFLTGDRGSRVVEISVGSRLAVEVVQPDPTDRDEQIAAALGTDPETASHVRVMAERVADNRGTLIFVNTRSTAEALAARFARLADSEAGPGVAVGVHHGSLAREARHDVEDAFKAGDLDGLICTSSMELGIDVGHVDHVVQYRSPREVRRLLQRVGRAGHRRDRESRGTVVTDRPEDTLEALAIGRRAHAGLVEPAKIHHGSRDTLANQIAGLVMDFGEIAAGEAYAILARATPFADVEPATVRAIVRQLARNNVVWLDEDDDRLSKRSGTWQYFYENLSMIPDEATYDVRDQTAGRQVGTLDEAFVRQSATPGTTFVQSGRLWRVAEVDDDRETVTVTPIEDPGGDVPAWTGQEIPVPRAVAQEVGELRRVVTDQYRAGGTSAAIAADLADRYPADPATIECAIADLAEQPKPVPSDRTITIEGSGREIAIVAHLGHLGSAALGRIVAALLGQQTGSSIGMDADPYRIDLELPPRADSSDVRRVLEETDPDHVRPLLELSVEGADALSFRLQSVARTFGALKDWRTSGSARIGGDRLHDAFAETPIYEEAIREFFHEELDAEAAADALGAIQSGERELAIVGEHTPIGTAGRDGYSEFLRPEEADADVIETLKDRLEEDEIRLFCVHCKEFERRKPIKRVRDQPECPQCGSTRIAACNPWDEATPPAVRADEKDDEQRRATSQAFRRADLVQSHGKHAVIALAGRGVGPEYAARIINKWREDEDDFYRDILEREREYARTKSFWD
ncbi:MAG: DEAD/DEAH box helicase, partial [Halococcoides sp.]